MLLSSILPSTFRSTYLRHTWKLAYVDTATRQCDYMTRSDLPRCRVQALSFEVVELCISELKGGSHGRHNRLRQVNSYGIYTKGVGGGLALQVLH